MADVMTVDTRVHPTATHVFIRVEIHHLLRAAEAADMLSCLSDVAALIAGSDYVELAEADPADAERWKSLALTVKETVIGDYWDLVVNLQDAPRNRCRSSWSHFEKSTTWRTTSRHSRATASLLKPASYW